MYNRSMKKKTGTTYLIVAALMMIEVGAGVLAIMLQPDVDALIMVLGVVYITSQLLPTVVRKRWQK